MTTHSLTDARTAAWYVLDCPPATRRHRARVAVLAVVLAVVGVVSSCTASSSVACALADDVVWSNLRTAGHATSYNGDTDAWTVDGVVVAHADVEDVDVNACTTDAAVIAAVIAAQP